MNSPLFSPSSGNKTATFITPTRVKHFSQHSTVETIPFSMQKNSANLRSGLINRSPQQFDTSRNMNYYNMNQRVVQNKRFESPVKALLKTGFDLQEENRRLKRENQDLHSLVKRQRDELDELKQGSLESENASLKAHLARMENENKKLKQELQNQLFESSQ